LQTSTERMEGQGAFLKAGQLIQFCIIIMKKTWKPINLEYGDTTLNIEVPAYSEILVMPHSRALTKPGEIITAALEKPIGSPSIGQIVSSPAFASKKVEDLTVAITISDHTRPVPYAADRKDGILMPLLRLLQRSGIRKKNILIIVGTGTHTATSLEWKKRALGEQIVREYSILDHDCTSATLKSLGEIEGIEVRVNEHFAATDLRIATCLVEPHFMAGFSGGAKAICPGLINIETTKLFHSAEWMDNPEARNLNRRNNPCFSFPREVLKKIGVHFSINCLINKEGELTKIYAGDIEDAHRVAADKVKSISEIVCSHEYEVVLTHGGKVAVNHYQAAKAAYNTIPIIARGGTVILAAHNNDPEPVGKPEYKELLNLLSLKGPGEFTKYIRSPDWEFLPDQWQAQKWDQFFQKVGGFENLIYCTTNIPPDILAELPGIPGYNFLLDTNKSPDPGEIVQQAIIGTVRTKELELNRNPRIAVLLDGPYCVPAMERL
jgi:lactate racemase